MHIRRWAAAILILGAATAAASPVRADDCFCLINTATGAILRGCEAYKAPTDFHSTAACTDPVTGLRSEQTMYADWRRIEAGADRCDPCRRTARGDAPEVPRKSGERARP